MKILVLGSYFKEENSFLKKRFFKSNSQKVFSLQKNENEKIIFQGPGEYNLSSILLKNLFQIFIVLILVKRDLMEKLKMKIFLVLEIIFN